MGNNNSDLNGGAPTGRYMYDGSTPYGNTGFNNQQQQQQRQYDPQQQRMLDEQQIQVYPHQQHPVIIDSYFSPMATTNNNIGSSTHVGSVDSNNNDAPMEDVMLYTSDEKKVSVDDFELLKVLGKGNFAKVVQVRKKDTGKIMAMKILTKEQLKARGQIEHTRTERRVLQRIEHPFLVKLLYAFQTPDKLYMVMEFINGGELFFHLKRERRFKPERARFYAAEILLALEHLHAKDIVYRDLKPENILMTKTGHVCITDFGLSKDNMVLYNNRTHTFCGTPEYLAPEILLNQGHGKAVDWWSFGTLLYEMLVGIPPFYSENIQEMYEMILGADLYIPDFVSVEASDLLARLLERNPKYRLGSGPRGADEIKKHPFFAGIDFDLVYQKKYPPPFVPTVKDDLDTKYFDEEFTSQPATDSLKDNDGSSALGESVQQAFKGFTYTADDTHLSRSSTAAATLNNQ